MQALPFVEKRQEKLEVLKFNNPWISPVNVDKGSQHCTYGLFENKNYCNGN